MRNAFSAITGKAVRGVARLRGGGSALPGLVVDTLDRGFLARVLGALPLGVVVVSGTNGKTTTTKMIVEMLEAEGLRVFTNRTGSNFSRGVIAAAVKECSWRGDLDADLAVLELDEAHAMHFIDRVKPRFTLLLNVLRDQLDRFGEIDTTAAFLERIAAATTEGLVVNAEDPLVEAIGRGSEGRIEVRRFGLAEPLRALFPSDSALHGADAAATPSAAVEPDVRLEEVGDHEAVLRFDGADHRTPVQLEGLYNLFNAAAALATVRLILSASSLEVGGSLLDALSAVKPAFGRGERLTVDGDPVDLVLVKNPAGFRLALASYPASGVSTMIAINDQYADGRDLSWLWDVDFRSLDTVDTVSGVRAWEMALRLEHDDVGYGQVVEEPGAALDAFLARTRGTPKRIYCTYTAMLTLRDRLAERTEVEEVW